MPPNRGLVQIDTSEMLSIPLTHERFPFLYRGKKLTISQVQLFLQFKPVYPISVNSPSTPLADYGPSQLPLSLAPPSVTLTGSNGSLATSSGVLGVPCATIPFSPPAPIYGVAAGKLVPWTLTINSSDIQALNLPAILLLVPTGGGRPFLNPEGIDDLFFVCKYTAQ
jgi:hypothetical protein